MTLLESLGAKLQSVPGIPSGSVFLLEDDDRKNTAVLVSPTQGYSEQGVPLFHEGFQILARALGFAEAKDLSWKAYAAVEGYIPKDADDYVFGFPEMAQPPSYIGEDGKKRRVFAFNLSYPVTKRGYIKK
jgi:hypothetical protein